MGSIETTDIGAQFKTVVKHWRQHHHNGIDMYTVALLRRLREQDT